MSSLVSPKLDALRQKLRDAEHGGAFFSSDDVAGMRRELLTIRNGIAAIEDELAAARRRQAPPARPAVPVGTFYFQPAGA